MILSVQKLSKSFLDEPLIKEASFHIEDYEKVGLVGPNGAGKSTLLKMLIGEVPFDEGTVSLAKGKSMGYLSQYQEVTGGLSIYEEVSSAKKEVMALEQRLRQLEKDLKALTGDDLEAALKEYHNLTTAFESADGYALKSEITGVLKGLGFTEDEFTKSVQTLSGGQKTRVALARLLLLKPDLLLLDEPTNHLDLSSISWLETFLMNYRGAVIIISHDRYFLNRVVSKILDLEQQSLYCYSGNYEAFAEKKKARRAAEYKAYLKQEQEIKHQEAVIEKLKSFNREKSIKRAESREKMLAKIERLTPPTEENLKMNITLQAASRSGNDVLEVSHLKKSFGKEELFHDLNFQIKRGEKVSIIGDNGTGKTTILKIINQLLMADGGTFTLGAGVEIGYYDQEHHLLHGEKTVFEEVGDTYPDLDNTEIRNVLAAFLFTGDDVFKLVSALSGGERGRLSLVKLMLSEANFLILDEPTNHLDMDAKEVLEEALNNYDGTVLYVSHDRYFINHTATRILELKNETLYSYLGNYDYYLEKKEQQKAIWQAENAQAPTEVSKSKLSFEEQKQEKAAQKRRENEIRRASEQITVTERRIEQIDELLTQEEVYTNSLKCRELDEEKRELEEKLLELYEIVL
ncbi:ATP-binding cassette domain-containing protein [Lachnospiraceae bacterium OttesenSCG-928-J05]|nr:ATP-binding cassette domain-containing protein [Lachnospiraceae bacterium OttesenSCG-928-J05]